MGTKEIIFSSNLNTFMSLNGYTQTSLAKRLGVSSQAVSKWSRGVAIPRMEMIDKICELFGVSKYQLCEVIQNADTMYKAKYVDRLMKYFELLNAEGLSKVLDYAEDLSPKYYEEQK